MSDKREKSDEKISRFAQGPRPFAYGDVWDRMTPRERRFAFGTDILVGLALPVAVLLLSHFGVFG